MTEAIVEVSNTEVVQTTEINCARCPASATVPKLEGTVDLPASWSEVIATGGDIASLKAESKVDLPNHWRTLYVSTQRHPLGYLCPKCASETSQYLMLELDVYSFLRFFGNEIARDGKADNAIRQLAAYLNTVEGEKVIQRFLWFKQKPALAGSSAPKKLPKKKKRTRKPRNYLTDRSWTK